MHLGCFYWNNIHQHLTDCQSRTTSSYFSHNFFHFFDWNRAYHLLQTVVQPWLNWVGSRWIVLHHQAKMALLVDIFIAIFLIGVSFASSHRFKQYNRRVIQLVRISGIMLFLITLVRFLLSSISPH